MVVVHGPRGSVMKVHRKSLRYLLVNVPLTDPTCPYHSIPYLIAAAGRAGYLSASCSDANIDALNFLSKQEFVEKAIDYALNCVRRLEAKRDLTLFEQVLYRHAIQAVGYQAHLPSKSISVLQDPKDFYDYRLYRKAVMRLIRWMNILSVQGFPGQFRGVGYVELTTAINAESILDVTSDYFLDRFIAPFLPFF